MSAPSHDIVERPLTADERATLDRRAKGSVSELGCIVAVAGVVPGVLLAFLGGRVASWCGAKDVSVWYGLGAALGLGLAWGVGRALLPTMGRLAARARRDRAAGVMQEIDVSGARVVEVALVSDDEPILAFDIGADTILFLQGQWLRDELVYGAPRLPGDHDESIVNGLPPPWSFPSADFKVTRFAHLGEIVSIEVRGPYLPPEAEVEALLPEFELRPSELLRGDLKDLRRLLKQAHEAGQRGDA